MGGDEIRVTTKPDHGGLVTTVRTLGFNSMFQLPLLHKKITPKFIVYDNHFTVLMDSVGQEFKQGIVRMACLCSMMFPQCLGPQLRRFKG